MKPKPIARSIAPRARSPLDTEQRLALVDALDALEAISTSREFVECMDGPMQKILPHDGLVCGMINNIAEWKPYRLMLHRFPPEYLENLRQSNGGYNSEMITRWRNTRAPVLADPKERHHNWWSKEWMSSAVKADLTNLAGHGFVDVRGLAVSYFCFIRIPERLGDKHVYLLNRLAPHLHMALVRAMATQEQESVQDEQRDDGASLSKRQKEILRWLQLGKTNREIAALIDSSEQNVKYHIKKIFIKLNTSNRTQAAAKALALKIIEV